ncbi:5-methyltetrahydropteroyltriglutamate--homocysteine S-methyltransferase [Pontiella agarivorans]|uniref:5-methyltetrahydropteroyltriglutamate--homocysteine methyltransferase n=1 Tax=Pontiella agarivorans TaxID=3038953 RepID=A0ABU5MWD6_9BACT|nr:5-methyltetrahydropteroyltriglutamate--homocysteine S-methyltransferase [Pontiella agarivorans]MDZ8118271.1 5-methyltetrahydropteroyltriglutamate--homocysteine S-methyltransferase [Pontiella agarivorans]
MKSHILGFPRIGSQRELKFALEAYWRKTCTETELQQQAAAIRLRNWTLQKKAGLDYVSVGDFSLYDHVLDMSVVLGAVPARFRSSGKFTLNTYFDMARGNAEAGIAAMEMTKWFDTNYHYIVPEIEPDMTFHYSSDILLQETTDALQAGFNPKPTMVGPLTYLALAKAQKGVNKWDVLESIVEVYGELLEELSEHADCIQLDEPIFCTDLPDEIRDRAEQVYAQLRDRAKHSRLLLGTYFGGLKENLELTARLPVDILHIDLVRAPEQLDAVLEKWPRHKMLSLGLIDGRNIWKSDFSTLLKTVEKAKQKRETDQLWIGTSCSLLHAPVSLEAENALPPELKDWMAFAVEKCTEVKTIAQIAQGFHEEQRLAENVASIKNRRTSLLAVDPAVRNRTEQADAGMCRRNRPFAERKKCQQQQLNLPPLPTTTIGSFPQTREIRKIRKAFREGLCDEKTYTRAMQQEIHSVIQEQEQAGLDVLVHGEPERNDMVEYFGQQLNGFCFSQYGWVQSYGSRCVKPPIIYGDISRSGPMTVDWITYAQSQTDKPMKGMLTGPVTILCWSFVRDDLPRKTVCRQIALAIRDEVQDLEKAGIGIIQIDEAALREGLPIRKDEQADYLNWAIESFRLATSGVSDKTQIHTHMCYSEFNAILHAIAEMDADVISIEASRSDMELLQAFEQFDYPNDIGPGVWDIHSPRVPTVAEICGLIQKALKVIPKEQLWINPDCGLKTRGWTETRQALKNMVNAAQAIRNTL